MLQIISGPTASKLVFTGESSIKRIDSGTVVDSGNINDEVNVVDTVGTGSSISGTSFLPLKLG